MNTALPNQAKTATHGRMAGKSQPFSSFLALFGIGMTPGNLIGSLADSHPSRGLIIGFGSALVVLAILASFGGNVVLLMIGLFGVGRTMMIAVPTIQVRLASFAPEAPTLMGAMNLAALNVANAIGAWAGGAAIAAGLACFLQSGLASPSRFLA